MYSARINVVNVYSENGAIMYGRLHILKLAYILVTTTRRMGVCIYKKLYMHQTVVDLPLHTSSSVSKTKFKIV